MINLFKLTLLFIIYCNQAYSDELVNLRFGSNEEKKRIVLDLDKDLSFDHKTFDDKIQINFKQRIKINKNIRAKDNLKSIHFDEEKNNLVLKFKKRIFKTNIYLLKKKKKHSFSRIVIDYSLQGSKKRIIIIDPGHGGKDSGAVGLYKNLEKNITLQVGLILKEKFNKETNFKVILTREKDIFLKLRNRTKIAKKKQC